ncbi:MAG TPA: TonB-dependent receptor, partial [Nitrospiria bacterium]|nr:TonB-dependent receptor [Nitrospiria bacterium]
VQEEGENTVFWKTLPVGLNEIERIEVVKGPGSAIWGPNAFDGVVNIITKKPEDLKGTHLSVSTAEFGTISDSLIHAGSYGLVDYKISLGYQSNALWNDPGTTGFKMGRFDGLIQYRLGSERRIWMSGGGSDAPRFEGPLLDNGIAYSSVRRSHIQIGYEDTQSFLKANWKTFGLKMNFYSYLVGTFENPVLYADETLLNFQTNSYQIEGQHQFLVNSSWSIVAGLNYESKEVTGDLFGGKHQMQVEGGYIQNEWNPAAPVTAILGARFDHHDSESFSGDFLSPRGSLVFRFKPMRQVVRLSYSEAYRPPTPLELFQVGFTRSPNLNPEKIASWETEYSTSFSDRISGGISLFYNRLTDLIDYEGSPISNLTSAVIYGGEAKGEIKVFPGLKAFANYAHQKIDQSLVGITLPSSAIRAAPEEKINLGLQINRDNGFSSRLTMNYVGKTIYPSTDLVGTVVSNELDSYTLVNLAVGYRWNDQIEITFSAFNLFNQIHREYPIGSEIGTLQLAQVNLNF